MPFAPAAKDPYLWQEFTHSVHRLEQLASIQSSGILHGPNGVGKSYLVNHFITSLSGKKYKTITLSHSSLTGSSLLRRLNTELGQALRQRRDDSIVQIRKAWEELEPVWPILIMEEAQNLSSTALEEIRLLCCYRNDTSPPFSLILVGDENLMPRLLMGINRSLLSRLGFCINLKPFAESQSREYIDCRLREVAIINCPFEPHALNLLIQSAQGIPRTINHLAQRSIEKAICENTSAISADHLQFAIDQMPWLTQLTPK